MSIGKYGIFYFSANILGTGLYFLVQYARLGNYVATENLLDGLILLGSINVFLLLLIAPFVRFWVVPEEIYNEQREIIDSYSSKNLKLSIGYGDVVYSGLETPPLIIYLPLNVINDEKQEIVDLECVLQVMESRTEDQASVWSRFPSEEKIRMAWEDGEYRIKLKPGNHEMKKLKIATLDCSKKEFRIAHENNDRAFPYFQVNTRYKLEIFFNGHLKGSYDYQSYSTIVDFVCVPSECVLDFSQRISTSPILPKMFKKVFEQ